MRGPGARRLLRAARRPAGDQRDQHDAGLHRRRRCSRGCGRRPGWTTPRWSTGWSSSPCSATPACAEARRLAAGTSVLDVLAVIAGGEVDQCAVEPAGGSRAGSRTSTRGRTGRRWSSPTSTGPPMVCSSGTNQPTPSVTWQLDEVVEVGRLADAAAQHDRRVAPGRAVRRPPSTSRRVLVGDACRAAPSTSRCAGLRVGAREVGGPTAHRGRQPQRGERAGPPGQRRRPRSERTGRRRAVRAEAVRLRCGRRGR